MLRGLLATKWKIKLVKLGHTALVASTSQFALGLPQLVFFLASPCIRYVAIMNAIFSAQRQWMSEKPKTSERIDEQYFSKIVEDFSSRAMKLESDLFRLNKTASIVDIRVEYQEIEKFSVINRFAKFHCRGQSDAAETSSSGGTTPTALKSCPQRYVTAFPMPRTVPEGAPCLSL